MVGKRSRSCAYDGVPAPDILRRVVDVHRTELATVKAIEETSSHNFDRECRL